MIFKAEPNDDFQEGPWPHLQILCLLRPARKNPRLFYLDLYKTHKSGKSTHLRSFIPDNICLFCLIKQTYRWSKLLPMNFLRNALSLNRLMVSALLILGLLTPFDSNHKAWTYSLWKKLLDSKLTTFVCHRMTEVSVRPFSFSGTIHSVETAVACDTYHVLFS